MAIHKEVGKLRAHHCELRMTVEGMRNTFEGMKFNRHVDLAKLLDETLTTFNRNRSVLHAMENCSGWKT